MTVNTNVAIYAFGDDDVKRSQALSVLEQCSFLSVQVLKEFAHALRRKHRLEYERLAGLLDALRAATRLIIPIDEDANRQALRLAERYKLSFYDALLLAVGLSVGARTIYSEDMHHGLIVDDRLRILNPFLSDEVL